MKTKITPISLAVSPSGVWNHGIEPVYDPQRQLSLNWNDIVNDPVMKATTQTYDTKGKPKDNDQD